MNNTMILVVYRNSYSPVRHVKREVEDKDEAISEYLKQLDPTRADENLIFKHVIEIDYVKGTTTIYNPVFQQNSVKLVVQDV